MDPISSDVSSVTVSPTYIYIYIYIYIICHKLVSG
ncbi:unnamed protein product [Musa textilis]